MTVRRAFISHFKEDRQEVDNFINQFCKQQTVFSPLVLGANNNDDFIDSDNPEYVMSQIRRKYLQDSTVTIVLVGKCTHSRRYIDWEIKSSLRRGENTPNGLIGIILPSMGTSAHLPPRFADNWNANNVNCYSRYYIYPRSPYELQGWIEDAYAARTARAELITNTQEMMKYNSSCMMCGLTH